MIKTKQAYDMHALLFVRFKVRGEESLGLALLYVVFVLD